MRFEIPGELSYYFEKQGSAHFGYDSPAITSPDFFTSGSFYQVYLT